MSVVSDLHVCEFLERTMCSVIRRSYRSSGRMGSRGQPLSSASQVPQALLWKVFSKARVAFPGGRGKGRMGKGMATPDKGLHYSNPFSLPEAPNPFINPWTRRNF